MILADLLNKAKHYLSCDEAEFLLQGLFDKKRYELYLDKTALGPELISKFEGLLKEKKQKSNLPIQYLLRKTYFLGYELYVDERAMIPRFETEELVMQSAQKVKNPKIIMDIGTGSGVIAIALAHLFSNAKIIATDISKPALAIAQINVRRYELSDRIILLETDLFPTSNDFIGKADLIIANLPYIADDEMENLSPMIKLYEPQIALNGGKEGFILVERLLQQAPQWLKPNGLLALEINPRQMELIKSIVKSAEFKYDNQGLIRYAFIENFGDKP